MKIILQSGEHAGEAREAVRYGRYRPIGFYQIEGMPRDYWVDGSGNLVKGPVLKKILRGVHDSAECSCPAEPCGWMKTKGGLTKAARSVMLRS